MTRFALSIFATGVLGGLVAVALHALGLATPINIGLGVGLSTMLTLRILGIVGGTGTEPVSPPNPERLHWHYLGLAAAGLGLFGALVLLHNHPTNLPGWGLFAISVGTGLWFAARQKALSTRAKKDPAFFDERARANTGRAERWAFLAAFEAALILGGLDYLGYMPLSGSFVGFGVAIMGVTVGILAQAWLEWRDSR